MGKIVKLLTGQDQIMRAAEVKTVTPSKDVIVMKRLLEKLFPIEVKSEKNLIQETLKRFRNQREQ